MVMRTRSVLLGLACLLVAASFAQATTLLVDRGLPTAGFYATNGDGSTNWALRSNIASGNYDYKDPANNGYTIDLSGDDFTMPATGPGYHVTDIRMWLSGTSALQFSDEFNSVTLMMGALGGPVTNTGVQATETTILYQTAPYAAHTLWQLDFPVNFTAAPGQQYSYAILPDGKASGGTQGYGEAYYLSFLNETMCFAQQGYNNALPASSAVGDGYVDNFAYPSGALDNSFTNPNVWGGVQAGDFSVQVFGDAVPEPITMSLVGMGIFGLGGYIRRRVKVAK
jgi:hypothetical protein